MADEAKFRLTAPAYLRMKGASGDPVWLEEGTEVGPGTAYDFDGPPTGIMHPLNNAAEADRQRADLQNPAGSTTLKGTSAPSEGGAKAFDPADPKKDSTAEKEQVEAKAAADKRTKALDEREESLDDKGSQLADREEALAKREAALKAAEAKPSGTNQPAPGKPAGAK